MEHIGRAIATVAVCATAGVIAYVTLNPLLAASTVALGAWFIWDRAD